MKELKSEVLGLRYSLVRSKRKTLAIVVQPPGEVLVRAPLSTPLNDIEELLQRKKKWIQQKLAQVSKVSLPQERAEYHDGDKVMYLGTHHTIKVVLREGVSTRDMKFHVEGTWLKIMVDPRRVSSSEVGTFLKKKLEKFFREKALEILTEKTYRYGEYIGELPSQVSVRYFKRRWGSTYSDRSIKYNYNLIMAPLPVINYVVVHELAHLRHFDHSPRFWDLVEKFVPDRKEAENWLYLNGMGLHV